ncbi:MAG TPA: hypothetical protein VGN17_03060 [Bryobacteraceae bacterium]|jgi:hypothetical protein
MTSSETPLWRRLPAALALALLAWQASVPWMATPYITQDGPSHLYNSLVFKDLLLHPHGFYASVYRFQPRLVTNWGTTVLLNLVAALAGTAHAEQVFATLLVVAAFACLTYFRRSLDPSSPACDPVTNFLLNTWFLWIGFYNFYLGMALALLLAGFYLRSITSFTSRRAAALSLGLTVLFFVHVLPATLAMLIVALAALWIHVAIPLKQGHRPSVPVAPLAIALGPPVLLLFFFVRHSLGRTPYVPAIRESWKIFPMHVFASAQGWSGEETVLVRVMLLFLLLGIAVLKRAEWQTPRPALAVASLLSFAGYLLVPNQGFGGDAIKIRLSWSMFIFGCTLAASAARLLPLRIPLALCITGFLAANLITTTRNLRNISHAVTAYESALDAVPSGSTFIRLRYGTQAVRESYGFDQVAMDPLFHADAWVASRRRLIDLTDVFALNRLFPVTFRKEITGEQQNWLYHLEDSEAHGFPTFAHVLDTVPFDYVVLVGDTGSEATRNSDFLQTSQWLADNMKPLASDSLHSYVRVYQRTHTP